MALNQFKGNKSCNTEASLTKVNTHQLLILIHIKCKFHKILFTDYSVTADFENFKMSQGQQLVHYC